VGSRYGLGIKQSKKNFLPLPEIKPQPLGHPAHTAIMLPPQLYQIITTSRFKPMKEVGGGKQATDTM